ncbi:MAG: phosphoglycerate mutase family protein, partial [Nitrospiraceae bacterium]|nr:phosphoglycerate mutase family protein [Nitrospiraceae bacterium]
RRCRPAVQGPSGDGESAARAVPAAAEEEGQAWPLSQHGSISSGMVSRSATRARLPPIRPAFPLTEHGRNQAKQIAQSYGARPTLIVVSSYQRTWQTAAPLITRFPDVPVEEWRVQEFTYLEPSRCAGTTGVERRPWVEHYWKSRSAEYCDGPGAESFMDLLCRVREMRSRFEALPTGSQVAVFTHGQFLQALRLTGALPCPDRCRDEGTISDARPGAPDCKWRPHRGHHAARTPLFLGEPVSPSRFPAPLRGCGYAASAFQLVIETPPEPFDREVGTPHCVFEPLG